MPALPPGSNGRLRAGLPMARRLLLLGSVGLVGCQGDGPTVSLKNDDVAGRIPAMKQAARSKDLTAGSDMVNALSSDDPAERMFAIESLFRLTGQRYGYHYYEDDEQRAPAVARWKEWLAGRPPDGPASRATSSQK